MKFPFKAKWLILLALIISAWYPIGFFASSECLANSSDDNNHLDISGMRIAAGYPIQPAPLPPLPRAAVSPSGPSSSIPASPSLLPTSIPDNSELPLKTNRLEKPSNEKESNQTKGDASNKGEAKAAKQKEEVTIEYDVSLAPICNQPGLSVVQSMNDALMNSPRAAAIRAQLGITRANYAYATQGVNPVMFNDRAPVSEQVFRLGPTLPIDGPWKLLFRMLATKRLVEQTKIDLLTTLWGLRADVRRAYVEVVVAQETLKTLTELYDLSSKLLLVAQKRFHAGDVPELDFLKARLANSQNEVELGVGKKRVLRSYQQLDVIMGKSVDEPISVPGLPGFIGKSAAFQMGDEKSEILPDFDRAVPPLSHFTDIAFNNRLELKSLDAQLKVNSANLRNAYGNVIPTAYLTCGVSTENNPSVGPKLTSIFYTLNAEMPMCNWHQGDIFTYKATARQLHYQIGAERNIVIGDVSSAYQNLIAQREKIRLYQDHVLSDSYEVARLARRSYEVGQSDITSTLQAQQANVQIRSQYLDAVTSYAQAFTDLEQASGLPLQ